MKITIAKTAGFCMGVRRAVDLALESANSQDRPIYTFGPLIHNPQVLEMLEKKGVAVLKEIPEKAEGTVIIRAHGVPPEAKEKLEAAGFKVIDATCPRVIKVQTIIKKHSQQDHEVIIMGDRDHPEVVGLLGHAGEKGHVVENMEELKVLPSFDKAIIVAQTTQNTAFYKEVKEWAASVHPNYKVFDTICDSTEKRQAEVKEVAGNVGAVVVVGGKNSGNTQRLAEVAREAGSLAFHVETEAELDMKTLANAGSICITAGASTPNWIIRSVYKSIEKAVEMNGGAGWVKKLRRIQRIALLSNLYLALGAGFLCTAASALQESGFFMLPAFIAALYVFSMQVFNQIISKNISDLCNVSEKTEFYIKHKAIMIIAGASSAASCLILSLSLGAVHFMLIFAMSVLGLCYNIRIIPEGLWGKYRKIKDIPGSKSVLTAAAWAILTTIIPAVSSSSVKSVGAVFFTFLWTAGMVFIRNAIFDTLDMQGDKISGKETIPILIGEEKTLRMLAGLFAFTTILPFLGASSGLLTPAGFILWIPPALLATLTWMQRNQKIDSDQRFEFMIESNFVASGITGLIWMILS